MNRPASACALACVFALSLLGPLGGAAASTDSGRQIYVEGRGSAPIIARVGGGGIAVPANAFPCQNCHKEDGRGIREGRLRIPDITWPVLTRPAAQGGRGYDEASFARAIREGRNSAGDELLAGMPRYELSDADLAALTAYVKELADAPVPGITTDEIRFATLLPSLGRMAPVGQEIQRAMDLVIRDINRNNRPHGRKLSLVPLAFDPNLPGDALRAARIALAQDTIFAFVANVGLAGSDDALDRYLREQGVPNIAPLATPILNQDIAAPYFRPSLEEETHALMAFLVARRVAGAQAKPLGFIHGDDAFGGAAAAIIRREAQANGFNLALVQAGTAEIEPIVGRMIAANIGDLVVFGIGDSLPKLLSEAAARGWRPTLLGRAWEMQGVARQLAEHNWPEAHAVVHQGATDPRAPGVIAFRKVVGGLGGSHQELQRDAYVALRLFHEGLRLTGRRLSRPALAMALAKVQKFDTGVLPPLSFAAGRFHAENDMRVLRFDPRLARFVRE